ncbi:hypothetical protein E3N88_38388 [Mikania micrantha]|uniref:ABC transmembrane type-1 domain-containing protein n=1 Tax=Mikania micrantha TaxID=192012 RepID=A0A5N6LTU2_9ASTR|nr:hypothetical protein E3N88_38388 [Mikania micrantha]
MMVSRGGLFGWSPPRQQPLTPVSEVSEPPESPSPYMDASADAVAPDVDDEVEEMEEIEPPPEAVPFSRLFACADRLDWVLMVVGSVAAAAHGTALVIYLHYFAKIIQLLSHGDDSLDFLFHRFKELALTLVAGGVFAAGWIEVSCWILTGERQTAVIRSRYVQVLLNQDMSFFDTYGNNGDIVSQVLSDVLLIQSALSEKVNCFDILATGPFIVAAGGISNIFLHRLAENIQDAYAEAASIAEQAISYIRTLYAFTNETLAKYSYAASLQATLRYGVLISVVQGLGLGFTYGLAICSCALQLYVGRVLVTHGKAHADVTKKAEAKAQALKTAKAVKTGSTFKKKAKKIRTKVTFHRPKTLKTDRNPKYPHISAPPRNKLDHYQILKYPLTTESAMKKIEDNNTLVFIVDIRADKKKIKAAVPDGTKKAYVRLTPDYDALDDTGIIRGGTHRSGAGREYRSPGNGVGKNGVCSPNEAERGEEKNDRWRGKVMRGKGKKWGKVMWGKVRRHRAKWGKVGKSGES